MSLPPAASDIGNFTVRVCHCAADLYDWKFLHQSLLLALGED